MKDISFWGGGARLVAFPSGSKADQGLAFKLTPDTHNTDVTATAWTATATTMNIDGPAALLSAPLDLP
jgi:hypothetical protein